MFELGQRILDDSATLVGIYDPFFYVKVLAKREFGDFLTWDKVDPYWHRKPLMVVLYDKPKRNMTREELAEFVGIPVDSVSDKLYNLSTVEQITMVVPLKAIFPDA